ncbi:uncharacterized protein RCO7_11206 [Rhynchosporium graminicola]|uniref:Uncharacterized protein n=1 Tax=Rhynchosporium graminicola TaxID=2792576 RepID=A0A1E1LCP7_9HELO|nr:uncharacterized protein RCO7_11206 [Rhynchosporium commune]
MPDTWIASSPKHSRTLSPDSAAFHWTGKLSPYPPMAVDLHFVEETGVARPMGTYRDLIRSQARRKLRQRAGPTKLAGLKAPTEVRHIETEPLDKLTQPAVVPDVISPLVRCPEGNSHDPFDSMIIGKRGKTYFYVKHYYITFKHTYPSDIMANKEKKDISMRLAMTDPSFLHATLFHSALNLCRLRGTNFTRDVYYHHAESIRIVNRRLSNPRFWKVSDMTLLTVACLLHFEILADFGFNGVRAGLETHEAQIHFDGLQAMVIGRGGLEKISKEFVSGKSACTFIAWTDTCVSIAFNIRPRFQLVQSEEEQGDDDWTPHSTLARRYQSKLMNLTGQQHLSQEFAQIYSTLRNVRPLPENEALAMIGDGNPAQVFQYKGQLERLERRSLALILSTSESSERSLLIYQLFGNAALIHALLFMRDSPASIPLARLLSERIRAILDKIDLQSYLLQYPEMVLWIQIMGGLGALGTSNVSHFAAIQADSCLALGLVGGSEIASMVEEFLWFDSYCRPVTMAFWNMVAVEQGAGSQSEVVDRSLKE